MIHLKLIRQFAAQKPDTIAFSGKSFFMTWRAFCIETERKIALLLSHYERELPQQAAYVAKNRIDLMPWLAALTTLGIPVTGIDYSLPTESQKALIAAIGADLILLSTGLYGNAEEAISMACSNSMIFDLDSATSPFTNAPIDTGADMLKVIANRGFSPRAFRAIGFTSGTTSLPKPVLRFSSFDQQRFEYFSERYHFSGSDKFLLGMPVYHAAGNGWARLFLTLGACVYLSDSSLSDDLAFALINKGITATVMTPNMLESILAETAFCNAPVSTSLRWLLVGGKHFPVPLKQHALERLGPCVYEYYGTTETGVNTIAEPSDIASHPSSVGKAYSGNAIVIVGPDHQVLPPLQAGSIAVNSYMNMSSYADGSASSLDIEGRRFLLTPEQGYLDEEGRLYLLNRSEQSGNHANLYGLEDAIRRLPEVSDVALLQGAASEHNGVTCVLTVRADSVEKAPLLSEINALAIQQEVELEKCEIVPRIPYSPSGKVRVRDLISLLATSQASCLPATA